MTANGIPNGYMQCPCGRYVRQGTVCRACGRQTEAQVPSRQPEAQKAARAAEGPNAIEAECVALFPGNFEYEARSFQICGGATYRPDWVDQVGRVAIEAKGEFIHSRDSRRRFDEAKHLHADWTWIWARKRTEGKKGKRWEIEVYTAQVGACAVHKPSATGSSAVPERQPTAVAVLRNAGPP